MLPSVELLGLSCVVQENEEQNADIVIQSEDLNAVNHDTSIQSEHTEESSQESAQNERLSQVAIHNGSQNFSPMAVDANNDVLTESDAFHSNLGEYTESMNPADAPVGEQYPLSSSGNEIWPAVSIPSAYYHHQPTSVSHGYVSVGELSHGHSQARQNQSGQAIVLESEIQQKDPLRSFLQRRSDGSDSFFYPYANQDRNELLLHSLFKDPGSSYLHEQKLSRLGFNPAGGDSLMGTGQFHRNLGSSLPLDPRHKRLGDVYMHQQNVQENIFADGGGRFLIPRQDDMLPLNHVQDWTANGVVNMPMPSHLPLNDNGQLSTQNWFPDDEAVRDGWSGVVGPSQDLGNGNQVADESLYSVLSQYNGLRPGVHYGSTGATEQFVTSGSYGGVGRGSVSSMTTNALPLPPARGGGLNYSEAQSGPRSNGLGWINLPHALHNTRPWNDNELG